MRPLQRGLLWVMAAVIAVALVTVIARRPADDSGAEDTGETFDVAYETPALPEAEDSEPTEPGDYLYRLNRGLAAVEYGSFQARVSRSFYDSTTDPSVPDGIEITVQDVSDASSEPKKVYLSQNATSVQDMYFLNGNRLAVETHINPRFGSCEIFDVS